MYSKLFAPKIQEIFHKKDDCTILATIPNKVSSGPLRTLLDALKKNAEIIDVTKANRDDLLESTLAKIIS